MGENLAVFEHNRAVEPRCLDKRGTRCFGWNCYLLCMGCVLNMSNLQPAYTTPTRDPKKGAAERNKSRVPTYFVSCSNFTRVTPCNPLTAKKTQPQRTVLVWRHSSTAAAIVSSKQQIRHHPYNRQPIQSSAQQQRGYQQQSHGKFG